MVRLLRHIANDTIIGAEALGVGITRKRALFHRAYLSLFLSATALLLTLISMGWLMFVHIREKSPEQSNSSWGATFGLLKDRTILFFSWVSCLSWALMSGLTLWLQSC